MARTGATQTVDLSPHELFHYSAVHQVLICTSCRYAIQPTAILRHLKDIHHLSRDERRPLIAYADSLTLQNAEEVEPPFPKDFPVRYLPVEKGWQCEYAGCHYLCVSTKRMQNHWSAEHGRKGDSNCDWSPALLQTFFRGKMVRYFTKKSNIRQSQSKQVQSQWRENSLPQVDNNDIGSSRMKVMRKIQERYMLDEMDSLILETYFASAYQSFATDNETERIWLDIVPGLTYDNAFLLHGILACTAQYMIHTDALHRQQLVVRACAHQECALPAFRTEIKQPTEHNCDAILAFAYLLVVYTFAADSDNTGNSLLIVENNNDSQENFVVPLWLHFLREGCVMLCEIWDRILEGPVGALATAWEFDIYAGDDLPYWNRFSDVLREGPSWSDEEALIYSEAALSLAQSFATMKHISKKSWYTTWTCLGLWPMRVDSQYMTLLHKRHAGALILLAYYCMILKQMERYWYFRGGSVKLMESILNVLETKWHRFIQEPISRVFDDKHTDHRH